MTEQEKIDQFNRDVDDVLKGNTPQAGTDAQRLDAARQLAAADFSAHSRARLTTRARLLARANRELPIQNKRKEMNTRFSNVFRTLAFGAFLLMIVFGLGWVLSNTTPQLGVGLDATPTAEPVIVPEEPAIAFPRQPADWGSMTALMNGRLVLVDGCLRIEDPLTNTNSLLIWPHDYDWQITEGIVEVLDGTGQVVARVGEEIWLGGGEFRGADLIQEQIPDSCSGPYWLVGLGEIRLVDAETKVERVIGAFGNTLQNVSLLSPTVVQEIQDNYAPYVAPELLATWINDPSSAPGRRVSSPWPIGIEILVVTQQSPSEYGMTGNIVEVTSEEVENGGRANEIPVQITVTDMQGTWMITSFVQDTILASSPTPLTLDSDSETIRQRILLSHTFWQALWADAQITDYVSGTPAVQRVQVWVNQPAQARVLSGKADGTPATLWISDGQMTRTGEDLSGYGLENFIPPMTESDTVEPHPMTYIMPTPLSSLLFPSGMAQRGGEYVPIQIEVIAGREALVVEWIAPYGPLVDRFWVDTQTGVILRQQHYNKGGGDTITLDYSLTAIQFDLTFHPETFNRLAAFPPAFAVAAEDIFTEVVTPMPEGEADTSLASGEIYLGLENPSNYYGIKYLGHFPASCLISGEPCPPVEFLADVPSGLDFPMGWSPDYQQAIFPVSEFEDQMWRFQRDTQTWTLLEMPYLIGVVWAPDGQWMVGQPSMYGNQEFNPLLIANANGSDLYEILDGHPGFENVLAWLDNTRIFIWNNLDSDTSEEDYTIYDEFQIYNTISQEVEVITGVEWDVFSETLVPSISPDKTQFIYALSPRNSNSSTVTRINLSDGSQTSFNLPISIWDLSWSPNGEWLALTVYVGSTCELHLVHPDGSDLHQIFLGEWQGACSNIWSPDGQYLLVPALAQTPTIPRLYVIKVATGESRLVELPDVGVEFEWPVVSWVP